MTKIKLPSIGFGGYRISNKSDEHREALTLALESGCGLIDTSANYTNGESELLIGEVIKATGKRPVIVTKGGYVQGDNLQELDKLNLSEGITIIDENLKHSIHPTFLLNQLSSSMSRLNMPSIDVYLLHNPEYYFYEKDATQSEYYKRIEKALLFLEEQKNKGFIKEYGISSNNFALSVDDPKATQFEEVIKIVKKHNLTGFTTIQFPMNLIELGALDKITSLSLVEMCMREGINTMINRPLNAFTDNGLVRLASYEKMTSFPSSEEAEEQFNLCMKLMKNKWTSDEDNDEKIEDIPVLKQFKSIWDKLPSPDAVDQVYFGHFFPLLAGIWGGTGLSTEDSQPFYDLYDISQLLSRKIMSDKSQNFKEQAVTSGLLPSDDKTLSILAIEKYLEYGIDCTLVGMREPKYVEQLKHLF